MFSRKSSEKTTLTFGTTEALHSMQNFLKLYENSLSFTAPLNSFEAVADRLGRILSDEVFLIFPLDLFNLADMTRDTCQILLQDITAMLYVIVTARSLLWMLTSLIATLLMLAALANPAWLEGPPQTLVQDNNQTLQIRPSVGVYARCSKKQICTTLAVEGLATDSAIFPGPWKAAVVFICLGLMIMCVTVFSSLLSCCFQSICRKSIFTLSGSAQAVAGKVHICLTFAKK